MLARWTTALALLGLLSACGSKEDATVAANVGEEVNAADFEVKDVTAIDAVTGEAANMAADVDFNEFDLDSELERDGRAQSSDSRASAASESKPSSRPSGPPAAKPAPAPDRQPSEPAEPPGNTTG